MHLSSILMSFLRRSPPKWWSARWMTWLVISGLTLASAPRVAAAQSNDLDKALSEVRALRNAKRLHDASDRAAQPNVTAAIDAASDVDRREVALWEIADVHQDVANSYPAGPDNYYARRAIDAWTRYVEFADAHKKHFRLHSAVQYLQDSYIQTSSYMPMFQALLKIPPGFLNDKVMARWEERLRVCPTFAEPYGRLWNTTMCEDPVCHETVGEAHAYWVEWVEVFNLRPSERQRLRERIGRVPQACRGSAAVQATQAIQ